MAGNLKEIRTVVDDEVFIYLSENMTEKRHEVGKYLELSESDIEYLESDHKGNQREINYQMFLKWKQQTGSEATYSLLVDALKKSGRVDLAEYVNKAQLDKYPLERHKRSHEASGRVITKKLKLTTTSKVEEDAIKLTVGEEAITQDSSFSDACSSIEVPSMLKGMFQKFVQGLKHTYQNLARTCRLVPFLNATVNDLFVDIKLEKKEEEKSSHSHWKPVTSYHNIVLGINAQRLLLDGDPGFGKSTLALQLAHEWSLANKESPLSEIDVFILIRHWEQRKGQSIFRRITLLLPMGCALKEEQIQEILEIPQLRIVFIFDGVDKTSEEKDLTSIMSGKMFPEAKVVIMTRPDYTHLFMKPGMTKIRLTGFDDTAQCHYLCKAVTKSENKPEKVEGLLKVFKKDNFLAEICHVPLFFTMFVHLLIGKSDLHMQQSLTAYFTSLNDYFFSSTCNDEAEQLEESKSTQKDLSLRLAEVAFEGLAQTSQNLIWGKNVLGDKLGEYGYAKFKSIGILVEDRAENIVRARFFHKIMQEFYGAYHLQHLCMNDNDLLRKKLNKLNDDSGYLFLFACGMDDKLANAVLNFLVDFENRKGQPLMRPAVLSFMEIVNAAKIKECISKICEKGVTLQATRCSKLYQRAILYLLQTASDCKIPVKTVELDDFFGSVNVETEHLDAVNGLQIPHLNCVKYLHLRDKGREWTEDEFKQVLRYASRCNGLEHLTFSNCLVPIEVSQRSSLPNVISKTLIVCWNSPHQNFPSYLLHLDPFRWVRGAVSYYVHGLHGKVLFQQEFERLETIFRDNNRDSEWQKCHVSTPPKSRNTVKAEILTDLSLKIVDGWKAIGERLQICETSLEDMPYDIDLPPEEGAGCMLQAWSQLNGEHATPQVLERALRDASREDLANELNTVSYGGVQSLRATSIIPSTGGTLSIEGTGVEFCIPAQAFQQKEQEVQIKILPHHSFDKPAKSFEDHSTVMVEVLPHNLILQNAATLVLPHCLKLITAENSDVRIYQSHHKPGEEPVWEDVSKSVSCSLTDTGCEIQIRRFGWVKYRVRSSQVAAKRLLFYAVGEKCQEDSEYVSVDVGCHQDLPGERKNCQEKMRGKFWSDSQSFLFPKEPHVELIISLVGTLPVWELLPGSSVPKEISYSSIETSVEKSFQFMFQRAQPTSTLPRCVFQISAKSLHQKYRLTVNFRSLQLPASKEIVLADDALLLSISHKLEADWISIGRRLQVREVDLKYISQKYTTHQKMAYEMLKKWKGRVGQTAFEEVLERVLMEAAKHHVFKKIRNERLAERTAQRSAQENRTDAQTSRSAMASSVTSSTRGTSGINTSAVQQASPPGTSEDPQTENTFQSLEPLEEGKKVVTDKVLLKLSDEITHDLWKNIGRHLKVSEPKLSDLDNQRISLQEKSYQMLLLWKQREGSNAVKGVLQRVLQKLGRSDLAEKLANGSWEEASTQSPQQDRKKTAS